MKYSLPLANTTRDVEHRWEGQEREQVQGAGEVCGDLEQLEATLARAGFHDL